MIAFTVFGFCVPSCTNRFIFIFFSKKNTVLVSMHRNNCKVYVHKCIGYLVLKKIHNGVDVSSKSEE